ncbi:hypothetical protein JNUCC0626_46645 [Lentzea sp. JNUCC 0626]|uniref:hypothetical protein n=1 Tax=Lentzea sp. JNUCC 0626 TaxID=3367513 RepID=UPI00374A2D01
MLEKFDLEVYEWSVGKLRRLAHLHRFRWTLGEALYFLAWHTQAAEVGAEHALDVYRRAADMTE